MVDALSCAATILGDAAKLGCESWFGGAAKNPRRACGGPDGDT